MIRVTRKYRFSASHRLHSDELPESENQRLYGKCNNPFGHGHNYEMDISVSGEIEPRSGRAVDIRVLDRLVAAEVLAPIHQKNLNAEVGAFAEVVPTTENLGREIHRRLSGSWLEAFPGGSPALEKIRLAETDRNIFEVQD